MPYLPILDTAEYEANYRNLKWTYRRTSEALEFPKAKGTNFIAPNIKVFIGLTCRSVQYLVLFVLTELFSTDICIYNKQGMTRLWLAK